eukprot:m.134777 g.134777  ORF g.134777 m.134777 type:complete len:326 (+) comp29757_c0_seq4:393-1370(+)
MGMQSVSVRALLLCIGAHHSVAKQIVLMSLDLVEHDDGDETISHVSHTSPLLRGLLLSIIAMLTVFFMIGCAKKKGEEEFQFTSHTTQMHDNPLAHNSDPDMLARLDSVPDQTTAKSDTLTSRDLLEDPDGVTYTQQPVLTPKKTVRRPTHDSTQLDSYDPPSSTHLSQQESTTSEEDYETVTRKYELSRMDSDCYEAPQALRKTPPTPPTRGSFEPVYVANYEEPVVQHPRSHSQQTQPQNNQQVLQEDNDDTYEEPDVHLQPQQQQQHQQHQQQQQHHHHHRYHSGHHHQPSIPSPQPPLPPQLLPPPPPDTCRKGSQRTTFP